MVTAKRSSSGKKDRQGRKDSKSSMGLFSVQVLKRVLGRIREANKKVVRDAILDTSKKEGIQIESLNRMQVLNLLLMEGRHLRISYLITNTSSIFLVLAPVNCFLSICLSPEPLLSP